MNRSLAGRFLLFAVMAFAAIVCPQDEYIEDDTTAGTGLKLRIGLEGGYSYRMARVSDETPSFLKDYVEELKTGLNYGIAAGYTLGMEYGICLKFSQFFTSNSMDGIVRYDSTGTTIVETGSMESNIIVSYAGVGLGQRKILGSGKVLFFGELTLGPLFYNDASRVISESIDISGTTFGLGGALGFDFMLSPNVALGFDIAYVLGSLSSYKVNGETVNLDSNEGLTRFDFNGGLRYYL